ncbi:MAG: hypothetical protein DRN07_04045 [Thermoplasmata archaeon]|nr:MAG: hypothetical protein DRN07_04045 [Thermoplasmata archaeon]
MNVQRCVVFVLVITLGIASSPGAAHTSAALLPASAPGEVEEASALTRRSADVAVPPASLDLGPAESSGQALPASVSTDWWAAVQENIRQSEYRVTWQDHTYLPDLLAAYQAPNRAHNLRVYFTPAGIRVIPRTAITSTFQQVQDEFWEWGLTPVGYGYGGDVQPVVAVGPVVSNNCVEYRREELAERYVNDERGLEQGFTLQYPPLFGRRKGTGAEGLVLELALTGDLTPDLVDDGTAIEFTSPGNVRVLRYSNLRASDATGRRLPAHLELLSPSQDGGPGVRVVVDDTAAVYPITVDSLVTSASTGLGTSPDWIAEGGQFGDGFGYSAGTAGDVNGDGYSDVIVGAYGYDGGQVDEGAAFVYHGSAAGLSTTADWSVESDQADAKLGISVGTAGDVNGDGYADVIVGANFYDNGQENEGAAFVYHGSAAGLSTTVDWSAEGGQSDANFGNAVSTAGDVNGDGYSDVIVGAYKYDGDQEDEGRAFVYYGSATGLSATADWTAESNQVDANLGWSVSTAGDVNGDGYADVIISAHLYDNGEKNEGRAFVFHGSAVGLSTTADWTAESNRSHAIFGHAVSTAGDVNGDGYADVIIGAAFYDGDQADAGRVYVYHGGATGLTVGSADWTAEGSQEGAAFGWAVGTIGDVNGDGYADVIIGEPYGGEEYEGRVYVYQGGSTGLTTGPAGWTAESNQIYGHFGEAVGPAGDVNGDGYTDVIIGASGYGSLSGGGRAFVYHGSSTGLTTGPANWTAEGDQANAQLGYSVGTAGDVNGDGYADVIVGVPSYDGGQADEGRAYVYYGSSAGLSTIADWMIEGDCIFASVGISVGTAGDVNGDGYADVVVGALWYDGSQQYEGRVYVYYGSSKGLITGPADWTAEGGQADAQFGWSAGTAGDVNGDGYSDVIIGSPGYSNGEAAEGRAFVYYGSSLGLTTGPADWTAESDQVNAQFGISVGTAGDVNGDGYSDVIIGAYWYDNGETDEGRVYVYYGSSTGLTPGPADWVAEGDQDGSGFGVSVGTAGDVNGDGYSDVIVGAWYYDGDQEDEGRVFVYHGSAAGLSTTADWSVESDQAGARLGSSVGTAGDVNGDGYADVIVGVPYYANGQTDEGRAYVYFGGSGGLTAGPADWTAEGDRADARFGYSVGTAGDVNGDGYAEVIIGAPYYDDGRAAQGRAYVYYGNEGNGLSLRPRQMRTDGPVHIAPLGISDSTTAVQLHLTGRMPLGREKVKLQWQVAPLGSPFTATMAISGTSAAWTDVLTTGVVITQNVIGLTPLTPYHWRIRLLYRPGNRLGQSAGRWVHIPWNGWAEQDFRTAEWPIAGLVASNDGPTPLGGVTTLTATVTAGSNVSYTWAFGDGAIGSGQVVTHTYPAAGLYTAVVTASNSVSVLTATTTVTMSGSGPAEHRVYLPLVMRNYTPDDHG